MYIICSSCLFVNVTPIFLQHQVAGHVRTTTTRIPNMDRGGLKGWTFGSRLQPVRHSHLRPGCLHRQAVSFSLFSAAHAGFWYCMPCIGYFKENLKIQTGSPPSSLPPSLSPLHFLPLVFLLLPLLLYNLTFNDAQIYFNAKRTQFA